MFTTVTDEAALYISQFVPDLGSSQTAFNSLLGIAFPPDLAGSIINTTAFPTNPSQNDSVRITGASALTHSEWTCPQAYLLRNGAKTTFPSLYEVEITDGHTQNNSTSIPAICLPNPVYNATCHSNDVLPAWGTLNSKTQFVHPYYSYADLLHSQLLNDVFGAFFRTYDPNPDVEMLKLRGPAYASTYTIFGDSGYEIKQHDPEEESLALLGMPPSQGRNPGKEERCRVFEEYGFTFENAKFSP
jgi:acetylcholinesterase